MTPRKPIKRVSARQSARLRQYAKVKDEYVRRTWWSCMKIGCHVGATEIHHSRGRRGSLLCNTDYWIPLCAEHHRWVHDNPNEARKEGLLCNLGEWGKQTP